MSEDTQKTRLRLEVRIGERRPVAEFELQEGETLEQRVKKEMEEAVNAGNITSISTRPTVPPVAVYRVDENGEPVGGSIAIFTYGGKEVTSRSFLVHTGKDGEGKTVYRLTCSDEDKEGNKIENVIGVFYSLETAERIGAFWSSGVLD